jgi:molecular chaperone DnaJ
MFSSGGVKFSFGGDQGGFGNIFEGMFGGGNRRKSAPRQNQPIYNLDIDGNLTITFLQSVLGVKRNVKVTTKHQCPRCHGSGADTPNDVKACPRCHGTGVVTTRQRTILGVMESQEYCPDCKGTGKIITKVCSECHGRRYVERDDLVEIAIPAGVANGLIISYNNKGNS